MKIILLLLHFTLCQLVGAQDYNKDMQLALNTWNAGNAEIAAQKFEKIAEANPDKWLPNYYVGLVNAARAFTIKDEDLFHQSLNTAQTAIDKELKKDAQNVELLVVQALIYTAYLANDPMGNGPTYYPKVNTIYTKASKIAPDNPRVLLEKARFEINSAQYTNANAESACQDLKQAKKLFANFKSEEAFYPYWGEDQLDEVMSTCD